MGKNQAKADCSNVNKKRYNVDEFQAEAGNLSKLQRKRLSSLGFIESDFKSLQDEENDEEFDEEHDDDEYEKIYEKKFAKKCFKKESFSENDEFKDELSDNEEIASEENDTESVYDLENNAFTRKNWDQRISVVVPRQTIYFTRIKVDRNGEESSLK